MHFLLGTAGLLALITIAFGARAASFVAAIILLTGAALALFLAFMVVTERL